MSAKTKYPTKTVNINGTDYQCKGFAYDGCHKIYLCMNDNDINEAKNMGYDICDVDVLWTCYEDSCSLRFIDTWKLDCIVPQFEETVTINGHIIYTYM